MAKASKDSRLGAVSPPALVLAAVALEGISIFSASQYTSSAIAACDSNPTYWLVFAWVSMIAGLLAAVTGFFISIWAKQGKGLVVLVGLGVLITLFMAGFSALAIFFGCLAPF